MTVLSALLVFVSIGVFASVYARANHRQSVLIVTQTIEQGQPIIGPDLGSASVSISGAVHPILVSDAQLISGRRAAVTIPSGSLLTMADTTPGQPITPGDAVVGVALKAGQLPSSGLEPGEQVMVVQTGAPGTPLVPSVQSSGSPANGIPNSLSSGTLVPRARVVDVELPSGGSSGSGASGASSPSLGAPGSASDSQLVSIEVAVSDAPVVSTAAAAGQISLVLLSAASGDSASGTRNGSS